MTLSAGDRVLFGGWPGTVTDTRDDDDGNTSVWIEWDADFMTDAWVPVDAEALEPFD